MPFYAHTREDGQQKQLLLDHLTRTAEIARKLGADTGLGDLVYVAGLLHDLGKYSAAFQKRITGGGRKVDHSTAGAREVRNFFKGEIIGDVLAYCIAGHHTGLPDYGSQVDVGGEGTLSVRLDPKKTIIDDYSDFQAEVDLAKLKIKPAMLKPLHGYVGFSISFLTRMIYSILVDADWIETESFMNERAPSRGDFASIDELCNRFNKHLEKFQTPQTELNRKRTLLLNTCRQKADSAQGFFTLTVPTGGGKTLASMAFALNHARRHGLVRIIYVIPFTGIIEQNAQVFKQILGESNILEHHSNFDWDSFREMDNSDQGDDESGSGYEKLRTASENWDIPIVVTTNVQFFESLFASKKNRSRKIHNIARSVVIFDEAQMLPREYLKPCMLAVQELVHNYRVTSVFCTATQPGLRAFMSNPPDFCELASENLTPDVTLKRVKFINLGKLTDEKLLEKINDERQGLCIVNTRRHAKHLFSGIQEEGRFHLSTLMCPEHRSNTLKKIRELLVNNEICRVVSTQVMEAGIDVDFPVGWRALAGLDSIIQAAGRINRECRVSTGIMNIFEPDSEAIKVIPAYIKQTGDIARCILRDFSEDPASPQAIKAYFDMNYATQGENVFDAHGILTFLNRLDGFDFRKAAERFNIIDNVTIPIIIPYNDDARGRIEQLRWAKYPGNILRGLQRYSVNIYENEFDNLCISGGVEFINDRHAVLCEMDLYDPDTGLALQDRREGEAIFFD